MKRKCLNINVILEDKDNAKEFDRDTNCEEEIISIDQPTRSVKMPEVPKKCDNKNRSKMMRWNPVR